MADPDATLPLAWPDVGPDEEAEVLSVLRSGRLALGPKTIEFEGLLSSYVGAAWGAAVSSGTAGLHLAVRALGIGPQDGVVTSSFSFVASSNCLRYEGAEPVFVDIEPRTLCIDPELVRAYLESCREEDDGLHDPASGHRVAAILPVDVFGHPADHERVREIASRWSIPLIADSCEALGSRYRRRDGRWVHAGSEAAVAVFAFYPNKQITTGEGGMVVGSDPGIEERVRSPRNQGRKAGDEWLRHTRVGFNYRIDEMSAALGVAQMRRIDELLSRRAQVAAWYEEELEDVEELELPHAAEWADPAWFVYHLRVRPGVDRNRLIAHLNRSRIESKAYFDPPIHRQPAYAGTGSAPRSLPETDSASERTMIVPFFSTMAREQVVRVARALSEGLSRRSA